MATLQYRDPNTGQFAQASIGSGMPAGSIVAFAGTTAPEGWHLCDGTAHGSAALSALLGSANTPDLRDRFVVSVGPSYAAKATGGASAVRLSLAESGNYPHAHGVASGPESNDHTHSYTSDSQGNHAHSAGYRAIAIRNTDLSQNTGGENVLSHTSVSQQLWAAVAHTHAQVWSAIPNANHTHTLTINASGAVAATQDHENMPPFYALAFIICKG